MFRRLFADMVRGEQEDISLAEAALYIAGEQYPDLDVQGYVRELDEMAGEAREYAGETEDAREALRRLSEYLFLRVGFQGNEGDYYDPENSYLNRVMDRKLGIPITLSIVYMEVARRLGMVLEGIGLPGHFILRHGPPEWELYVDPFHGGQLLSQADCEQLVQQLFHGGAEFQDEFLLPCTQKAILVRLLSNLKSVYGQQEEYRLALAAADRIALVEPRMAGNHKDRAALYLRLGEYRLAAQSLQSCLNASPEAQDAGQIRDQIQSLWQAVFSRN